MDSKIAVTPKNAHTSYDQRRILVFEQIRKNPKITHNVLCRLVCDDLKKMALKTYNKIIHQLLDEEIVIQTKWKNRFQYEINTDVKRNVKSFEKQITEEIIPEIKKLTKIKITSDEESYELIKKVYEMILPINKTIFLYETFLNQDCSKTRNEIKRIFSKFLKTQRKGMISTLYLSSLLVECDKNGEKSL